MKKSINSFIFFSIFVVFLVGFYLIFTFNSSDNGRVELISGNNAKIKINNSKSISDQLGKKIDINDSGYLNFSIKSENIKKERVKYEIYVKQINSTNSINYNYIRLYLTNKKDKPFMNKVESFGSLKLSSSDVQGRRLYVGTIKKNEIIDFTLRMWLSDTYTPTSDLRNFSILVGVNII